MAGRRLLRPLDGGDAAVGVAEDELDEDLARREVRRARPRPVPEPGLAETREDRDGVEGARLRLHPPAAEDARTARHAEDVKVARGPFAPPHLALHGVGGE